MKKLFAICLAVLLLASGLTYLSLPEHQTDRPIIYWTVQPEPAQRRICDLFYAWREQRGLPPVELRFDAANRDKTKKMVQGVSGMGSDLLEIWPGEFRPFQSAGILADVTELMRSYGATPTDTYPTAVTDLVSEGRQYAFPRSIVASLLWVNRDALAKHGVNPPNRRWTIEEFDRLGREFVAAANPPGQRDRVYFLNHVPRIPLRRSLGVSIFNETLTRCTLDDPRNLEMMRYIHKWVVVDKLVPTREAEQAFAADVSGIRLRIVLFARGQYAMLYLGRWATVLLRDQPPVRLAVVEPFHGGFPNVDVTVGGVGVYAGSRHKEIAASFLGFLASPEYNLEVVRSGDSLPPLPAFAQVDEFRRPPAHPNEWGAHEVFAETVSEIGISPPLCPYVLSSVFWRIELEAFEKMIAGRLTPDQAGIEAAERINREIDLTLETNPEMRPDYEVAAADQRLIDQLRSDGRLVPERLIRNPFHRAYYRAQGWLARADTPTP
ncbi:MAG: carbohydrate ABC transporter substrate-binding protein [Gemmataceae bacterium]|nr:carbohydrate ABC transporter substrate-binding protein [Gemmataceae bacterium]